MDKAASETFDCKTSCTGIHTDVTWHDEAVGKSRDGGKEEDMETYNLLVEEYRQFQRNYSRNFRFDATADAENETFGKELVLEPELNLISQVRK